MTDSVFSKLNDKQKEFLALAKEGRNVFLTGPAGTGKTFALKETIRQLRHAGKKVVVTATVAQAASHLGGTTIHQAFNIYPNTPLKDLMVKVADVGPRTPRWIRDFRRKWIETDVLVIEEVSACTPQLFYCMDAIVSEIRDHYQRPFGGLQVILGGDFCQLPPILCKLPETLPDRQSRAEFVHELPLWQYLNPAVVELTEPFRQLKDLEYFRLLSRLRLGGRMLTEADIQHLNRRRGHPPADLPPEMIPVELQSLNDAVNECNQFRLAQLDGEEHYYRAYAQCQDYPNEHSLNALKKTLPLVGFPELVLKIGARVVLLVNDLFDQGVTNGSQGLVVDYDRTSCQFYPVVQFDQGPQLTIRPHVWNSPDGRSKLEQLPLALAFALSIHKSMGMSLDRVSVNLRDIFEHVPAMAYVALSRCTESDSLYIAASGSFVNFKAHPKAVHFYSEHHYRPLTVHATHVEWIETGPQQSAVDPLLLQFIRRVPGDPSTFPMMMTEVRALAIPRPLPYPKARPKSSAFPSVTHNVSKKSRKQQNTPLSSAATTPSSKSSKRSRSTHYTKPTKLLESSSFSRSAPPIQKQKTHP